MIDFSPKRWHEVKENYRRWWAGELKRPLFNFTTTGRDPGRPAPRAWPTRKVRLYDPSYSPEEIADAWEYDLSTKVYLGDAFPCVWPDFGPGVMAAFIGAVAEPSEATETVWFHPAEPKEMKDIRLRYHPEARWAKRIKDIYRAAQQRFGAQVLLGMTDLGGNLDILSTFRPAEQLLLDLYDHPEEVKRVTWEAHEIWFQYFDDFNRLLQPVNPGYSAWAPIYSDVPYYMLQCDFCYMIGPKMFDEFVKPELEATCQRIPHCFYHLDGKGQLPHLDSLLRIKELKGVQWIPGAGAPDERHWPEVYRKIRRAGKLIQIFGFPQVLDPIVDQLGSAEGIILINQWGDRSSEKDMEKCLLKYGAL